MSRLICMLALLLAFPLFAQADSDEEIENIREKMKIVLPGSTPDAIIPAPIDGFYEVSYGTTILYVSGDTNYVFEGILVDIGDGKKNLTELSQNNIRKSYATTINQQDTINFGDTKPRHTVNIFTDIDCGYCRKLHAEIEEYASYGIQVRYLLYPRGGLNGSASHSKAVSVWCSDDRKEALTKAKAGEDLEVKSCDNPIADHYQLGRKVGVTGTPAIFTEDGQLIAGYLPPKQLAQRLDEMAK